MINLLYVTNDIINKLKRHRSYFFWLPIVQNFPIKNIPVEERAFHPRPIKVENGYIYLTLEMKFVYARDNMFSFLYENQDLSYRFSSFQGILRTLDNKQFSALIGKVAKVTASTEIELVEEDKVHHPLFDSGLMSSTAKPLEEEIDKLYEIYESKIETGESAAGDDGRKRKRGRPRKNPLPEDGEPVVKAKRGRPRKNPLPADQSESPSKRTHKVDESILDNFPKSLCDEVYAFRVSTRSNFAIIGEKFGIEKRDARLICKAYKKREEEKGGGH